MKKEIEKNMEPNWKDLIMIRESENEDKKQKKKWKI